MFIELECSLLIYWTLGKHIEMIRSHSLLCTWGSLLIDSDNHKGAGDRTKVEHMQGKQQFHTPYV